MFARFTKLTTIALALAALCVALAATATAGTAAKPKPGFMPGTWVGKGTISGRVEKDPMTTTSTGRITFVLKVNKAFGVSGTGTWRQTMVGTQDAPSEYAVNARIWGTAPITFSGTSINVKYKGKASILTAIQAGSVEPRTTRSESDIFGFLTIKDAFSCSVSGKSELQPGVFLTWSATFKGACG